MMFAVIGYSTIAVGKLKKVDVAGAKGQCRSVIETALYTHFVCSIDNSLYAHFLAKTHGYGVDTLGKSTLQRHGVAGEGTVGIAWCPGGHLMLLGIVYLHGDIFVTTLVTWR